MIYSQYDMHSSSSCDKLGGGICCVSRHCDRRASTVQVVVLERDQELPPTPSAEVYADADEYSRDQRARRGVPQFVQIHGMLRRCEDARMGVIALPRYLKLPSASKSSDMAAVRGRISAERA